MQIALGSDSANGKTGAHEWQGWHVSFVSLLPFANPFRPLVVSLSLTIPLSLLRVCFISCI